MSTLFSNHYYHEQVKRLLTAMVDVFSNIHVEKKHESGASEQTFKVPVEIAQKNKWVSMVKERNDVTAQQVQITLPRIAIELGQMEYDSARKQGMFKGYARSNSTKIYNPAPYNVSIQIHVLTKDQNTALQIVEQILPFFQPLLSINFLIVPEYNIRKDVPLILNGQEMEDLYEGNVDSQRLVTYTFNLTAQMVLFPRIDNQSGKIIKHVRVDYTNAETYYADVNPSSANKTDPHTILERTVLK